MKNFRFLFLFALFFIGCDSKIELIPKDLKWDREVCERCKMIISERKFGVQIVNQLDGKRYYFDDIGCAVLWFDESKIPWESNATIFVNDAKSGEWLDAKTAFWIYGEKTPMDFGYSAYKEEQSGKENLKYEKVRDKILGKPQ